MGLKNRINWSINANIQYLIFLNVMQIRPHTIQLRDSKRKMHFLGEVNRNQLAEMGNCELVFLGNGFGMIKCADDVITTTQENKVSQAAKEYLIQQ